MKKAVVVLLISVMTLALTACGNKNYGPWNFTYKHVHISDAISGHCYDLEEWNDDETGIELKIKGGSSIFLSEGTYMLFGEKSDCPYCD